LTGTFDSLRRDDEVQTLPYGHVNYHESVLRIQDRLPKFNDLP